MKSKPGLGPKLILRSGLESGFIMESGLDSDQFREDDWDHFNIYFDIIYVQCSVIKLTLVM